MSKLVVTLDGKVINQLFIEKNSLTIGRAQDNDIVIDDPQIDNIHVRIIKAGKDDIVEALESREGARVNGKPLVRQILQHRDIIEMGRHQVRYMSSRMASEVDLDRTMLIQALTRPPGASSTEGAPPGIPATAAKVKLQAGNVEIVTGLTPHESGQLVALARVVTTFGVPGDKLVVLTRRPQGVYVTHVEGPKFPRVNRQPITAAPHALKDGDLIEAAGYTLRFRT